MYTKKLVTTKEELEEVCEALDQASIFAYDTETNGKFSKFKVQLVGLSFCTNDEVAYYIPVGHNEGEQLDIIEVLQAVAPFFTDPEKEKICHNVKFDEKVLSIYGIEVKGPGNDTFCMGWMLNQDKKFSDLKLKLLVFQELDYQMETYEEIVASTKKVKNVDRDFSFAPVSLERAVSYAADDAYWTFKLYYFYKDLLEQRGLWSAYTNVERPFQRITRHIEDRGIFVDQQAIQAADEKLPKLLEEVESAIYEQAGEVFNIGSGPQLGRILFEKLGIGNNVPKTKKGQYVTDAKVLKLYRKHEIVENVLRYKKIKKTHSTFVTAMRERIEKDGRIHPGFNGCGTATGRLSSQNPNFQNIEGDEVEAIKPRSFFIPPEGYKYIVADYGQIEYRIMAHLSKDEVMLDAFASGHDFHAETARKVFNIPSDQTPTHRQRFIAKSINFGIGYGRGFTSLAETLGCTDDEAKEYIADYYRTFKGLAAYKKFVLEQTRKYGYVTTITGRKRYLPMIKSNSWGLRGHAERQAFNTKCQGSAADIIKAAMISLEPSLVKQDAHMCIQVHDELVVEVPEDKAIELKDLVTFTMAHPIKGKNPLILPLAVDPKVVDRWSEGK